MCRERHFGTLAIKFDRILLISCSREISKKKQFRQIHYPLIAQRVSNGRACCNDQFKKWQRNLEEVSCIMTSGVPTSNVSTTTNINQCCFKYVKYFLFARLKVRGGSSFTSSCFTAAGRCSRCFTCLL